MPYEISIEIPFRAGHRLIEPYEGRCNNPHGEGYTAIVFFEQDVVDSRGMIMDFGEAKRYIKKWIDENWDHHYIHHFADKVGVYLKENGFATFEMNHNPTAEKMAEYLFNIINDKLNFSVYKVGIVESFRDSIGWYVKKGQF